MKVSVIYYQDQLTLKKTYIDSVKEVTPKFLRRFQNKTKV